MPHTSQIEDLDGPHTQERNIEHFINIYKIPVAGSLIGLIFIGSGVFLYKQGFFESSDKVEIIKAEASQASPSGTKGNLSGTQGKQIIVEISGATEKPGVYKLDDGSRVEDLLIASGGISAAADRVWVEKFINRAAKLNDGQKLYIMKSGEVSSQQSGGATAINNGGFKVDQGTDKGIVTGSININTGSLQELDSLPGIGQVYGQSIIEHRPYSTVEELVSKGAIKQNVFEKIKDNVSVF